MFVLATGVSWPGSGPARAGSVRSFEGRTMGTAYRVSYVLPLEVENGAVRAAVEAELAAVSARASTWDESSELSRFNAHVSLEPFEVSRELAELVESALRIARETGGAFDPTVQPLVRELGFGASAPERGPDPARLAAARARVGFEKVRVEGTSLVKLDLRAELDLSGIAPGDAVDRLGALLERLGATAWLIDIGGELRARGRKPLGAPWVIGVESPAALDAPGDALLLSIELEGRAAATSGDYRRARGDGERRVHHLIDPRTGANPAHDLASVTVLAPTCARADALATALFVLGADEGRVLAERLPDVEALFVRRAADGAWRTQATSGFPAPRAQPR